MRFLVTNDDGINSMFLHELVRALRQAKHEVFVAAPKSEQSWIGAAKSRNRAVHAECLDGKCLTESIFSWLKLPHDGLGCSTWVVDGTPSDAVNIAIDHLLPRHTKLDGVISGINMGLNASLGFIIASGTIGGAWEGALHGLPAIAFSQNMSMEMFEELKAAGDVPAPTLLEVIQISAQHAARMAPELIAATPSRSFIVHNVNFPHPCQVDTPVRRTIPARVVVPGLFSPAADDGTHRLVFRYGDDLSEPEVLTDRSALDEGFISHSVLDYRKLGL